MTRATVAWLCAVAWLSGACGGPEGPRELTVRTDPTSTLRVELLSSPSLTSALAAGQGGAAAAPVDMSYSSQLTVGTAQRLVVWPRGSDRPVNIEGTGIKASYYHIGRVLVVEETVDGIARFHYFAEPTRWSTLPR